MAVKRVGLFLFHWVLPVLVLAGSVIAVMLLGTKAKPTRKQRPVRVSVPVDAIHATLHQGTLPISTHGTVVPFREVELAAEVGGQVVWKSDQLRPGRFIKEGEELLRIDPVDFELEIDRLTHQLKKSEADLAQIGVAKENTQRLITLAKKAVQLRQGELDRVIGLRDRNAATLADYDTSERDFIEASQELTMLANQLNTLDAESESMSAAIQLAKVGLEKAKRDLTRATIRAPFSGVVITQSVEQNSHLQPGQMIAKIEDTKHAEIRCNLRKDEIDFLPVLKLKNEKQDVDSDPANSYHLPPVAARVTYTRAGKTYAWNAVLSRQDGLGMDERTRTMPVRLLVDNPRNSKIDTLNGQDSPIALVRGMFVKVDLLCEPDRPLLKIPEATVRPGKCVWLIKDEALNIHPIRIVRVHDGIAYIDGRGALDSTHSIISSPVPGAKSGLAVKVNSARKRTPGKRKTVDGGLKRAKNQILDEISTSRNRNERHHEVATNQADEKGVKP